MPQFIGKSHLVCLSFRAHPLAIFGRAALTAQAPPDASMHAIHGQTSSFYTMLPLELSGSGKSSSGHQRDNRSMLEQETPSSQWCTVIRRTLQSEKAGPAIFRRADMNHTGDHTRRPALCTWRKRRATLGPMHVRSCTCQSTSTRS